MCSKNSQAQSECSSSQRPRVDLTMGKQKAPSSSIQKGWFYKHRKPSTDISLVAPPDTDAYLDLSLCVRDLAQVSKSTGEFFLIPDGDPIKDHGANLGAKIAKNWQPLKVTSTKIGQIIVRLINSPIHDSALLFIRCWANETSNYALHPAISLFLKTFPQGYFDSQFSVSEVVFIVEASEPYQWFNDLCKSFRKELNSSEFKLKCRNFERNSQESKLKLKKAFGTLLRKKKRVYVLRFDLDSLQFPRPSKSLETSNPPAVKSLFNPRQPVTFDILSTELKNRWEALCRGLRRSKHFPRLFGHASRLHYFPSIGFRLHVMLIFECMSHTEGCRLRDAIVHNWENHITSGHGVANSRKSSSSVSSFLGCGEITAKGGSRLDDVYEQAIPYLTDMDLHLGRIMKHRTFNMWHSK